MSGPEYEYDITFVGTALVDSIVRDLNPEPVSATGYLAASGTLAPGGEAVNGAMAAARLGLRAVILCSLGQDAAGDLVTAALVRSGVDVSRILRPAEHPTPVSTLLVNRDGTRRSITNDAHRYNFHPEARPEEIPRSRVLVLGSLFRAPFNDPEAVRGVLTAPTARTALRFADTKLPNFRRLTLADLADSLPLIDYIFPNEDEGAYCTGKTDPVAMADVFLDRGVKNVIVKLGSRGCLFRNARETIRLDAYEIDPVDATGAGDNFLAGFAAALLEGKSHGEALRFANACGALCTTVQGAAGGLRSRSQVLDFLRSYPDPERRFR